MEIMNKKNAISEINLQHCLLRVLSLSWQMNYIQKSVAR